jgi:hypothetical protein
VAQMGHPVPPFVIPARARDLSFRVAKENPDSSPHRGRTTAILMFSVSAPQLTAH